jgi:tRNA pseudouridine13 synthase
MDASESSSVQTPEENDVLPRVEFRSRVEDFIVDEIPLYPASGAGEHLYVTFRKTNLTTEQAVRAIARHLESDPRASGYAGMKDKRAITTQTASFAFPLAKDAEHALDGFAFDGIEILEAKRHANKLKPGHLLGNRFRIVLRGADDRAVASITAGLGLAAKRGVPNAYGPQRFGRDGSNPERALAWLAGKDRGPRDRREQRLLFSSLQSMMFNEVLDRRVADGTWDTILLGDVAKKREGALFVVREQDLSDAVARASRGEISATGPMFGASMTPAEGTVRELEESVLHRYIDPEKLESTRQWGEGTRRPMRLALDEVQAEATPGAGSIALSFVLPKGGYATTVLAAMCHAAESRPGEDAAVETPPVE